MIVNLNDCLYLNCSLCQRKAEFAIISGSGSYPDLIAEAIRTNKLFCLEHLNQRTAEFDSTDD